MAGRVQLETTGIQDKYFTDDPEFTYFIKNFKKHGNYSRFQRDLDLSGNLEFGEEVRCTIPQDQGDLLKGINLNITLGALDQSIFVDQFPSAFLKHGLYVESIGHAMIEYAELHIGGYVVQRIPSDMLAIHSEIFIAESKQSTLDRLIGKPVGHGAAYDRLATHDNYGVLLNRLNASLVDTSYRVYLPFYFHDIPELAVPLFAITSQEVEVVIKFRKLEECILYAIKYSGINELYSSYKPEFVGEKPKGLIKKASVSAEIVLLKDKKFPKRVDYLITQTQTNTFDIYSSDKKDDTLNDAYVYDIRLNLINPVKEMFFVVQDKYTDNKFMAPFDYSAVSETSMRTDVYTRTNYEHIKYIGMELDNETILDEITGHMIHLRAIQPAKHHSRSAVLRIFYTYSFALEPEKYYPSGQFNFSNVKNQLLKVGFFKYDTFEDKQLRVYAQTYNILRVENGTAKLLFNS